MKPWRKCFRQKVLMPLALVFLGGGLSGCSKPASDSAQATSSTNSGTNLPAPEDGRAPSNHVEQRVKDEKTCFACMGQGTIACTAPGCVDGKVECPGPCLKLNRGQWIHMNVEGHSPSDLWRKFEQSDNSYTAWNQNHVGEVIVMQNGKAVNIGKCKLCGGTTRVNCSVCKGTGTKVCTICEGKMQVPLNWTPTDNPWLNRQPDLIRLRDGSVILGKIVLTNISSLSVKSRGGQITHVKNSDILPGNEFKSALASAK